MKYGKLIFKNLFRNLRRSILTVSSLAVSLFLIVTLATVVTEFKKGSEGANPLRLVTRHKVSLVFQIPLADQARISAVKGVKAVTPFNWFGGIYKEQKNFFANFAVDPKLMRQVMPEIKLTEPEWTAFIGDRQGAVIGKKLADKFDFKIGQRVTLKSEIYHLEPEFIIRGICTGGDEKTMYFSYEYFNEMAPAFAKDKVGTFFVLVNSVEDTVTVPTTVDAMFNNTDAPTKTESEKEFAISFQSMMGNVQLFMYGIIAAIVFSLMLIVANSMAMSVRERTKEVGTLKALGFQRGAIAWLFVGESLLLALTGAVLGIGFAILVYNSVDISGSIPFVQSFVPSRETLLGAFILAITVGVVSVTYSAYRVSGITIAEALRRAE